MLFQKRKKEIMKEPEKEESPPKEKSETREESWLSKEGELMVDVFTAGGEIIVQAPLAGIDADEVDIIIDGDVLKIKGERKNPFKEKIENKDYLLEECYWGPFSKEIVLPVEINKTKIQATIKQGILVIKLPKKTAKEKEKKIEIKE